MIIPEFTAPSYRDRTLNEVQRMVNLYPEKTPQGYKLISYPGFQLIGTVANNAGCRGAYFSSSGQLFSVNGNTLYEVFIDGSSSSRGTISTSSGAVYFADNGTQLFLVVQDTNGYTLNMASGSVTIIPDANFPANPIGAAYMDGYFITCKYRTGLFYLSQLNDAADWTPVQFATAEYSGDSLHDVKRIGNQVYFFGKRSIEPWYNTGNASFPLERISGGIVDFGTGPLMSVGTAGGEAYFVGSSQSGRSSVHVIGGGGIRKISTPYIESVLSVYPDSWEGYCHNLNGHDFYEIHNFTGGGSVVYDISTGAWLERVAPGTTPTNFRPIINAFSQANAASFAFNYANGGVYSVASGYNSDAGTAIPRIRTFGPIGDGTRHLFHDRIEFVLEADHDSSASYTLSATLEWSDNGGLSWSSAVTLSKAITSGTTGQTVVLYHNRLGSSKERFYRLTFTGPSAKLILKTCDLEFRAGRH